MISRRVFLKMGCVAAGTLAVSSLLGCSAGTGSGASDVNEASQDSSASNASHEASSQADNSQQPHESSAASTSASSTAVVFFSCTGNTEAVADEIAQATNGTLMRINPAEPYTSQDLDYNSDCRANREQQSSARPALAPPVPDIAGYSTVYIGYPIWWGKAPRIVLSFLEDVDTAGKTLIPFCTSGSSPITGSIDELHSAAPNARWLEGRRFSSGTSQQEIDAWVASLA